MRNKLQNVAANTFCFSSIMMCKNRSFYVITLLVFLLISVKGNAQLNETFDSGIPGTWTLIDNGVGTLGWSTTTDGYLGTNGTSINPSADNIGDQNTAQYFLVTPQIAVPENGEIQFYTKQSNEADNGAQYEIRLSTAAQPDVNGFNITIQSYTEANLNIGAQTNYEKKVIEIPTSIPAGLNIYIAFVAINTQNGATPTGDEWFVDNVSILEGCSEVEDDTVTIDAITVDGAEVSWTHPTATNFEIQILPADGVPADSGIPVSGTSYTLTNLDEDTDFDIYISAICDNDTQSAFTGPYTFSTLKFGLSCDAPIIVPDISSTPYVLVDNLDQWINPDISYTTQGTNCVLGTSTTNYLNGNKIFLSYTPTEDGLVTLTQTTAVEPGGGDNNCWNSRSSLFVYESCEDVGVNCIGGTITINSYDPKSISNLLVQAGETYIIVVSTEFSTPTAGVCFSLEITAPNCAPPSDLLYNNLTEDSVSFSWDNIGGFADTWEYAVVPSGTGEPTGSGISTSTNIDNLVNTGLVSATTYDLYVRSICDGTPGIWSDPMTFTTQCASFSVPYFTNFDTATNENPEPCWTTIDANGDGIAWSFIGGWATVQTESSRYENHDFYVSPRVIFDGTPKRIRYKHRSTQGGSTYTVKLSTTGVGLDDFSTVVLPPTTITNSSFQEIIVDLPEDIIGEVNIAWIVEPNTTESALRVSIDDVYIEEKPTCPDPLNPYVLGSQITTNSAWLLWSEGDSETQWQLAIQDEGSGIPTGDGILVSDNLPYIATDLSPGNRYEFYVRAYCSSEDQSQWVGPVTFTTLCESYDSPFYESFNDEDPDTQKFCWEINDANNDGATWMIDESHALLQTSAFSPPSDFNDYLISPAINIDGVKELKYKYRSDFSFFSAFPRFGLEVLMSTTNTNPGSFSVISPLEVFTNPSYEEKSIIIEATGTIYIAFRVPPEFTGAWSVLSIEDVSITDISACPNPTDLVVNNVFTNFADLSWTAGYQETDWNVAVQLAGSGIPSSGVLESSNGYIASDLLPNTEYEFYVQANCEDGNSEWVGPITFRTSCSAFTSPFVETFNTDSESEDCWIVVNNNEDGETWELNSASLVYEGDQAAAMFTGTNGLNEDWLISPTITITENQRLRYYYRVYDSFFTEDLEVLLSTNGTSLEQFTTVLYDSDDDPVLINNEEFKVKIINLPAGITGDINIAFHVPFFASTEPYRGQTLVIDNVNIEDIPDCPEPTNIILNNITDTQVQVSWDANVAETAWEISVQPSGTAAPVGDTDPEYLFNASTNPFTVTGLDSSTMYDIYVRAVCDEGSEWVGPYEVITKCSFENLCQYTFILTSDYSTSSTLDITQNNQVVQSLPFTGQEEESYSVFLCSGVEFSLFFDTIGWSIPQYANYQFEIQNNQGETIYTSPLGLLPRTTVYTGSALCGTVACPQPTDLTVNNLSELSWTPGGGETAWEVAIQPFENGTLPQSGTIVSTNSYTPTDADFNDLNAVTYEYFVRAVCGSDEESYWSGPFEFVRNDDVSNAITLPINDNEVCSASGTTVSFINASASVDEMTCEGVNGGDIWFDFTAESLVHIIEVNNFSGSLQDDFGDPAYPGIIMTLYKDNGGGNLEEVICSYDNLIVAMYTSELIVGQNYKVRLTLNSTTSTEYLFNVCIKTPEDLCSINTVNGNFEEPNLEGLSGLNTIISVNTLPGWRSNLDSTTEIFYWESLNAPGFEPYEGGQCVQLLSDQGTTIDPNDPDIKGYYRDFDTSEITLYDYSFAHLARSDNNIVQLFAGPVGGPYTMIDEHLGTVQAWTLVSGEYSVPAGQDITRFIFRAHDGDDLGNVLDAINFVANNEIITAPFTVDCDDNIANVEANGTGTWVSSDSNPGTVSITDANSSSTTITNFVQPGVYTFTWQTSYCAYDLEITYNGIADIPETQSLVEYCLNSTAEQLTASTSDTYNLMWFTQAVGGTGTTTAPTPDTSVVNTTSYYVAFVDTEGCEGSRTEIQVVVSESFTPELTFTYDDTCVVATENPIPTLNTNFETGGTFSSTTLTVDTTTGIIDMASASVGQHDIIYTYDGDEETCTLSGSYVATIEFTAASIPVTVFNYGTEAYCVLSSETIIPTLTPNFTQGGTFSSSTLTVNATTGAIDMASATSGSHEVTYTVEANATACSDAGSSISTILITASTSPITEFSYAEDIYCADTNTILPEFTTGFTTGGTFSAESGLSINATTGEINVALSTLGNYDVTYEILEDISNCAEGSVATFNITILDTIGVVVEGECDGSNYTLTALPIDDSFDTTEANYTWKDASGNIVGDNSEVFNVTDYANQNPNLIVPLQFSVTVDFGGCSTTTTYTTERLSCGSIPQGISPDGNNKNDTFDLTGYGVNSLLIFNRYGTEVYKYNGNYTNQWHGQTNDGKALPDGTYFYSLQKDDGSSVTGWVYINRAQ